MVELTEAQRKALAAARERRAKAEAKQAVTPRERLRAAAQGLTLGAADEIEAGLRTVLSPLPFLAQKGVAYAADKLGLGDKLGNVGINAAPSIVPYGQTLDEIRGSLKSYQEAYPMEALAYEVGGAMLPAVGGAILAPATGGASAAAVTAPSLARLAAIGALEGGAYAFNTGEGGLTERALRVPLGVAGGAAGGAVGGAGARAAGGAVNKLADAARRLIGKRGSTVVENEIQRLVTQTGKSADEIAADILNGRILAENETIRAAVRAYRASGGEASTVITQAMTPRPSMTRAEAMKAIRGNLSDENAPSAVQAQRRSEDVARTAEDAAYSVFDDMPASGQVTQALGEALKRVPSAADELNIALRAATGQTPFFKILDDDSVVFTRPPTVKEAEVVRRAIANRATSLYTGSMAEAGKSVKGAELSLRSSLDEAVPELATTRATAAAVRAQNDAFKAGNQSLSGDVYQNIYEFNRLTDPAAIEAYRAGVMAAIERQATTGGRQSLMRNITNPDTKEGLLIRAVLPQDEIDSVLNRVETASMSQKATDYVTNNSVTFDMGVEKARRGLGVSAADAAGAMSLDVGSLFNVVSNILSRTTRDLTDAERARVARILVSDDPELVRRAIIDESGWMALQQRVQQLTAGVTKGARRAAASTGGEFGGDTSQEIGMGLLAQ